VIEIYKDVEKELGISENLVN